MRLTRYHFFFLLTTLIVFAIFPSCKEKNPDYPPHTWIEFSYTASDIKSREISAMYYENDHSSWLGSKGNEGLLHYDGYKWNVYDNSNTGIGFDSVTSIVRDGNGTLWVGWRSGLASYDGNKWSKVAGFDNLCVTSVVVEGIGNIRVGMKGESGGTALLQNNTWSFYTPANSGIPSGDINAMVSDQDQVLWMATADKGVILLKNSVWENMTSDLPVLSQNFTCIALSTDGSIWAGSDASQLIHFYNDTVSILNTGTSKPITSLIIADDGSIWCSTSGAGLIKFDGKSWSSRTTDSAALPSNDILCLSAWGANNMLFSIPGGKTILIKQ
jgi:ligand-binding sensor domain-containing protein